ncbi:hypothetical protein, partial [Micromonospora echinofusca]|nr:hypothetical protein [Micromonospora echinofusca]
MRRGRRYATVAALVVLTLASLAGISDAFGVGDAPDEARSASTRDAERRDRSLPHVAATSAGPTGTPARTPGPTVQASPSRRTTGPKPAPSTRRATG